MQDYPKEKKTSYQVKKKWKPFYNGGPVSTFNNDTLLCPYDDQLMMTSLEDGRVTSSIDMEGDPLTYFYVTQDQQYVVTASQSSLLKQWKLSCNDDKQITHEFVRKWKAQHTSPVICMDGDRTSTLLATGGADGLVKVWDLYQKYQTHNFRFPASLITAVRFHPESDRLVCASGDYKIRVWNLHNSQCELQLDGHNSAITSLQFAPDNVTMMSGGRDRCVCVWKDVRKTATQPQQPDKVVPIYESVESLLLKNNDDGVIKVIVGGGGGCLSVWNCSTQECELKQPQTQGGKGEQLELMHSILLGTSGKLVNVLSDHTIEVVDIETLEVKQRFAAQLNEVTGVHLLGNSRIAVVTDNSRHIKIFETSTPVMSYQTLKSSHTDAITNLTVSSDGKSMISAAHNGSISVWFADSEHADGFVEKCTNATAHVGSISALAMASSNKFFISGGIDNTLKKWRCVKLKGGEGKMKLKCDQTSLGHNESINSIDIAPTDVLACTGSQDKSIKLWSLPSLELMHSWNGAHSKGVWCVKFAPSDKVLASASADGYVKIWGVMHLKCLHTIDAHDCSIFSLVFMKQGTQFATSGSDGLIKFWDMKTLECRLTLEEHDDNVWSLAATDDGDMLVSGSRDGTILQLEDKSTEMTEEERKQYDQKMEMFEELRNLMHEKQVEKALKLAIRLEQPQTALKILKDFRSNELESTLGTLSLTKAATLLRFAAQWNTISRNTREAHLVFSYLLSTYTTDELLEFDDIVPNAGGLLLFSERHYKRSSKLHRQVEFLEYSLHQMNFE